MQQKTLHDKLVIRLSGGGFVDYDTVYTAACSWNKAGLITPEFKALVDSITLPTVRVVAPWGDAVVLRMIDLRRALAELPKLQ